MFVLEWGSKIQTEHCLFLRTCVKGLFVPSLNLSICLSKTPWGTLKPLEYNLHNMEDKGLGSSAL